MTSLHMFHRSKKGVTDVTLEFVFWLIYITIVCAATIYVMALMAKVNIDAHQLRSDLFVERLIYSPQGIIYVDEASGRSYAAMVDAERFTQNNVDRLFNLGDANSLIAANISIRDAGGNELLPSILYNPDKMDLWRNLLWDKWSYSRITYDRYVSLRFDLEGLEKANLNLQAELEAMAADPDQKVQIGPVGPHTPAQTKILKKQQTYASKKDELEKRMRFYSMLKSSPDHTMPAVLHVVVVTPRK